MTSALDVLAIQSGAFLAFCVAGSLLFCGGIAYERGISRGRVRLLTYQRDSANRAAARWQSRVMRVTAQYRWCDPPTSDQPAVPIDAPAWTTEWSCPEPDPATRIRDWDDDLDGPRPGPCATCRFGPDEWLCPPNCPLLYLDQLTAGTPTPTEGAGVEGPDRGGDAAPSGDGGSGPFDVDYIRRNSQEMANGCWRWTGFVNESGYGRSGNSEGTRQAHRLAYEIFTGPVPDGHQVDHRCHTEAVARGECEGGNECPHRSCVNPEHLEAVTARENVLRGNTVPAKHAAQARCVNGHPFDEENTRINSDGERACRACDAERQRGYRERRKQDSHDVGRTGPEPAPHQPGEGPPVALHAGAPDPTWLLARAEVLDYVARLTIYGTAAA